MGTVSSTIKKWTDTFFRENRNITALKNSVRPSSRIGNKKAHLTSIPSAQAVFVEVRDFVPAKCSNYDRVTATHIFHFLKSKNVIANCQSNSNSENNVSDNSSIRTVQRWLLKNVFKRGAKSGNNGLKYHIIAWRNSYL